MPEAAAARDTVRVIASEAEAIEAAHALAAAIAPGAAERDAQWAIPHEPLDELRRSGLLGINVPAEHGGAAVSYEMIAEVFRILAAADPAVAQVPQNHFHFVTALERDGTPAQQERFFAEVLAGARFGNALQERGRDFRIGVRMQTRLRPDGDGGYVLNGRKFYCTGAYTAQWIPVFALDESDRLVIAYVERHADGVEVDTDWHAMGQRGTYSGTTTLTDVRVAADQVVEHWRTMEVRSTFPAFAQLMHAAIDVGIGAGALADAVAFVQERSRPWIESGVERAVDDPLIRLRFGELKVRQQAAEALLRDAARALDAADGATDEDVVLDASLAVSAAKAFGGEVAVEIASELFSLAGTSATDDRLNLHRHWRNARTHTLHDPNRWKYHHIGDRLLNGTPPPNSGLN